MNHGDELSAHVQMALEIFEPLQLLDGEPIPVNGRGIHFTPNGEPLRGSIGDIAEIIGLHQMDSANRVQTKAAGLTVSTTYLGIDHTFGKGPIPLFWETMLFGEAGPNRRWRYGSRGAAMNGHRAIVDILGWQRSPEEEELAMRAFLESVDGWLSGYGISAEKHETHQDHPHHDPGE